jgi:hypothetical protein
MKLEVDDVRRGCTALARTPAAQHSSFDFAADVTAAARHASGEPSTACDTSFHFPFSYEFVFLQGHVTTSSHRDVL